MNPDPGGGMVGAGDEIAFVLALARALHRYGTPAHRLEEAMRVACARLGLVAETFSTPTAIIMSFGEPTELRTRMMRVEGGENNMAKLAQIDALADAVAARELTPAEGLVQIDAIQAAPSRYRRALVVPVHGVTSGSLAVFFGGSLPDVVLAAAIGVALGLLAQVARRSTDQARVFELIGAAFAAFVAGAVSSVWPAISPSLVTIASLIVLLPGMTLTVAMTELATKNLISGTARLMSAVIVLLELVVGVAVGERAANAIALVHEGVPVALPAWAQWIALLASAIGVAIVVQTQARAFGWIVAAA
ncbi:MAG: threonine/serine exporter family protein, partial [Proteobacteria bacterium]|nr:threonine/serine exporter family protein [Pseudomonadota bacterium]